MKIRVISLFILLALSAPVMMVAQEAAEEPIGLPITAQVWQMIDLDAEPTDESEARYVIFLSLDDGAILIEVVDGADVVHTRGEDGLYSGAPLVPTDAYEFESVLEVIDEETLQAASVTRTRLFTSERHLRFERTELEYGVWVEGERDLTEFSMFAECMGLVGATPPGVWATPDPILPIRLNDEDGVLYIGHTMLTGGGSTYERSDESPFGQFTQVITQTAVVSENRIDFSYHAIAGGRDDCELRYETSFVPFDEDYEALLARGIELSRDA